MSSSVQSPAAPAQIELSLVLGGGNALGAYHLGACEALFGAGWEPDWLLGASIGAVTAAILAGNPPERRLERLRAFWGIATQSGFGRFWPDSAALGAPRGDVYGLAALAGGRPGLFGQRFPGLLSLLPGMPPDRAIRDHAPMARTLERLIDFDLLNRGDRRVSCVAVDMEAGDEVWFDNRIDPLTPEHLLACTALAPLFPPVEIGGRLLCDAGLANNLPFDRVFREDAAARRVCIAVDLFHPRHGRPDTLGDIVARVQDLGFGMQTSRSVEAVRREQELRQRLEPEAPGAILAHLAYRAPGSEHALKALDFSRRSLDERRAQGAADMEAMLRRIVPMAAEDRFVYLAADPPNGERAP